MPAHRSTSKRVAVGIFAVSVLLVLWAGFAIRHSASTATDSLALQQRVLSIAGQLRALGDQNTMTVASSTLPEAQHMRYEIQQDLLAGMSTQQILKAMVSEYGPDVLAAPPTHGIGIAAWLFPLLILLGGAAAALRFIVRKSLPGSAHLRHRGEIHRIRRSEGMDPGNEEREVPSELQYFL